MPIGDLNGLRQGRLGGIVLHEALKWLPQDQSLSLSFFNDPKARMQGCGVIQNILDEGRDGRIMVHDAAK